MSLRRAITISMDLHSDGKWIFSFSETFAFINGQTLFEKISVKKKENKV